MKRAVVVLILLGTATGLSQPAPVPDVAAALKSVVPDLDKRLARFRAVRMPYNEAALSPRERQMIEQLVIACRELESIYWRQSDPEVLALYNALDAVKTPASAPRSPVLRQAQDAAGGTTRRMWPASFARSAWARARRTAWPK